MFIFFLVKFLLIKISFAQMNKPVSITINGSIKNLKPGDTVLLIYLYKQLINEKRDIVIDYVVPAINREFRINKKLDGPG
jgi:hypothetical protein